MKKLSKDVLDAPIYLDKEGKIPFRMPPDPAKIVTARSYFLQALDMPAAGPDGRGIAITRERIKRLDALDEALKLDEPILEEADFTFLGKFIDELQVAVRGLHRALTAVVDTAVPYRPGQETPSKSLLDQGPLA